MTSSLRLNIFVHYLLFVLGRTGGSSAFSLRTGGGGGGGVDGFFDIL